MGILEAKIVFANKPMGALTRENARNNIFGGKICLDSYAGYL